MEGRGKEGVKKVGREGGEEGRREGGKEGRREGGNEVMEGRAGRRGME